MCVRCGAEKPLSDYYAGDRTCKICRCALVRERRRTNPKVQEYDRNRGCRQNAEYLRGYRARYPKKYKAHQTVAKAIKNGVLTNPGICVKCTSEFAVEAHHDDYDFPLTVRWLCAECHKRWHAEHGEALNGE
jgi:transposase-like protein